MSTKYRNAMRYPVPLFLLVAAIVGGGWWWLGQAVAMPPSPLAPGEKLYCVSYAPFRSQQTPLDSSTRVDPAQIDQDLAQLSRLANCVRSYSIEHGLDRIAEIAKRHGLKVIQGLWLSSDTEKNRHQIESVIALAKRFPDVIQSIVVGNEVLLRGEMSVTDLTNVVRGVKSQVSVPVTYADVWEFWLRSRDLVDAVDFVTIHILPYWEDFPIAARYAATHVDSIRERVVAAFPGKEILIGETGWPSAGRMREGALPSPVNQARVLHDVLTLTKTRNFRVNLIEAYDQPWKRQLEGTVGGHWGLLDAYRRDTKFTWGHAVSNHPAWLWQAAGGVAFAACIFGMAIFARRRAKNETSLTRWLAIAATAGTAGLLVPWSIENVSLESLGIGGWARSLALVAVALAAPIAGSVALAIGAGIPSFTRVLGRPEHRPHNPLSFAVGLLLVALTVLSLIAALALDFDPRYRDFPAAPLTAATVPFLALSMRMARPAGTRGGAEIASAVTLVLSAVYVLCNESFANWQAIWFAVTLIALGLTLFRVRDVQD
ncbi:MAG: beta-(1-6) glucans synthase [Rhizobiales bacterium]|nr:beta-(1-6) glucans synthase [Hyphomicrobiales bacterium]